MVRPGSGGANQGLGCAASCREPYPQATTRSIGPKITLLPSGRSRLEGADVSVAQAVVDECEQSAGDCDGSDVASAAGGDLGAGADQPTR